MEIDAFYCFLIFYIGQNLHRNDRTRCAWGWFIARIRVLDNIITIVMFLLVLIVLVDLETPDHLV